MSGEKELSISTAESLILPNLEFLRHGRSQVFQVPSLGLSVSARRAGARSVAFYDYSQ